MNPTDANTTYTEPVAQLLTLGDVRSGSEWPDYRSYGLGEAQVAELIRMATDEELRWADSDTDEVWAPIHARRALGQLGVPAAIAAIEPLVAALTDEDEDDWTLGEIPVVLAMIGPAALPALRATLADHAVGVWQQIAAAEGLCELAQRQPEQRQVVVEILTEQLRGYATQDETLTSYLISYLTDLKAVEAAPEMAAAFAADRVDLAVQGDWEEVQIELGLLTERLTPPPAEGWLRLDLAGEVARAQRRALRQAESAEAAKRRAKRKQAKATKRKQTKPKKKKKRS